MADRIPLIYNTTANQIQEIPVNDTLDLTGSNVSAGIVSATIYTHPNTISQSVIFDSPNQTYAHFGEVTIGAGVTVGITTNATYIILSKQT